MNSGVNSGVSSIALTTPATVNRRALMITLAALAFCAIAWFAGWRQGLLFVIGVGLGATLSAVAFGFTTSWRVFIKRRDPTGVLAQFLALALAMLISIPLIAAHPDELSAAAGPLSVSLLIGAFIFGAAMQIADGCGSGTLYKAGLGHPVSLAVLPGFIAGSFLGAAHLDWWLQLGNLGPYTVQQWIGVPGAIAAQLAVLAVIAAVLWRMRRELNTKWQGKAIFGAALVLAVFAVLNLIVAGQPWGIVYGLGLWGAKIATLAGWDASGNAYWGGAANFAQLQAPLLDDVTTVTNLGLLAGAMIAALWRGTAFPAMQPTRTQWFASIVGGVVLGYTARLAFGCNIGAYFAGISTGSVHGWVWLVCAFAGSLLGVKWRTRLGFTD